MAVLRHIPRAAAVLGVGALALALPAAGAAAERPGIELGVQANALSADPDIYGYGLAARYPVRDRWFVDAVLERRYYATRASGVLGGAELQSTVAGVALGRHYPDSALGDWFWSWGLAAGLPDVGATTASGSGASVATIEIHLRASLGIRRRLTEHWSLAGALELERHFVDWRLADGDGREIRRQSSLTPAGLYVALNYRF